MLGVWVWRKVRGGGEGGGQQHAPRTGPALPHFVLVSTLPAPQICAKVRLYSTRVIEGGGCAWGRHPSSAVEGGGGGPGPPVHSRTELDRGGGGGAGPAELTAESPEALQKS